MFSFLIILMTVIGIYIIYRIELSELDINYTKLKNNFLIDKNILSKHLNKSKQTDQSVQESSLKLTANLHNSVTLGYTLLIINILIGFSLYFKRQWKDHAHHWNWITFLFGGNKCKGT